MRAATRLYAAEAAFAYTQEFRAVSMYAFGNAAGQGWNRGGRRGAFDAPACFPDGAHDAQSAVRRRCGDFLAANAEILWHKPGSVQCHRALRMLARKRPYAESAGSFPTRCGALPGEAP